MVVVVGLVVIQQPRCLQKKPRIPSVPQWVSQSLHSSSVVVVPDVVEPVVPLVVKSPDVVEPVVKQQLKSLQITALTVSVSQ